MAREFEFLAKAIVFQAYKDALVKELVFKYNKYTTTKYHNEALEFIGSEWYYELTDIDHKSLQRIIREKAEKGGVTCEL